MFMRVITSIITATLLSGFVSCGPAGRSDIKRAAPPALATPANIDAMSKTVSIVKVGENWTPHMYGANEGAMLTNALKDHKSLMLILDKHLDGTEVEQQLHSMIKAASPQTAILARGTTVLDALLKERGEIPYRTTLEHAGSDILGRPVFVPKEHPLNTDWLSKKKALNGADTVMTVRKITLTDERLREIKKRDRGGCDQTISELTQTLTDNGEAFKNFKDELDRALQETFVTRIGYDLPQWKAELAEAETEVNPKGSKATCLKEITAFVNKLDTCRETDCEIGPRFFPNAGGFIGMNEENSFGITDRCLDVAPRNYVKELERAVTETVAAVLPAISDKSSGDLQRLGAVEHLVNGMKDVCTIAHRRISSEDLKIARSELSTFASRLSEQTVSATWKSAGGLERVAGEGPVKVFAKARPTGGDAIADADTLITRIKQMSKCHRGHENIYQVTLIEVGTSKVVFMDLFFGEQLFCEDLAPGQP